MVEGAGGDRLTMAVEEKQIMVIEMEGRKVEEGRGRQRKGK